jgi:hypothetical protein
MRAKYMHELPNNPSVTQRKAMKNKFNIYNASIGLGERHVVEEPPRDQLAVAGIFEARINRGRMEL